MKNIIIFFFLFSFSVNSQNTELKEFVNDLFYELPNSKSIYSIQKEMNKSKSIKNIKVRHDIITSDLTSNPILNLNTDSELLVFFDENNSSEKRILIHDQTDKSNFYTIFNLLKSFNLTFKMEKGIDGNENSETYHFWKDENQGPIMTIKILPWPKLGGEKIKSTITFSVYDKNLI